MEQQWYFQRKPVEGKEWILASDVYENDGRKKFMYLDNYNKYITFLERNKEGALYEITKTANEASFMFYDIDIKHAKTNNIDDDTIVKCFLEILQKFLKEKYNFEVEWAIGVNCQIATASVENKCSLHIVMYIKMETLEQHKLFTINLIEYIIKNDIQDLLYVYNDKINCAIDSSVYHSLRCYRCLYMMKLGKNNMLKPYGNSSVFIKDHLINYYDGISNKPIFELKNITLDLEKNDIVKKQYRTLVSTVVQPITVPDNNNKINEACEFIRTNQELLNILKVKDFTIRNIKFYSPQCVDIDIKSKPDCGTIICPYANRKHKSNNIYIRYSPEYKSMHVHCYDEHCKKKEQKRITCYQLNTVLQDILESSNIVSLHSQEQNIEWTHVYDEPKMKKYPNDALVCIRAGMGTGKTETLKKFINKNFTRNTKSILITFSRSLAKKYAIDLKDCGFINYQDVKFQYIQDSKVIVCLDSLMRVAVRNPDYIFIDEALSVFLHFHSSLMQNTSDIAMLLELLLLQAKKKYFLDACLDNVFTYNVINYVAKMKGITPIWIHNKFIRETNRRVELYTAVNNNSAIKTNSKNVVSYSAIIHIYNLLAIDKKIVICSSTKSFTKLVEQLVKLRFPTKSIKVYNSEVCKNNLNEEIDTRSWNNLDVLVYSPSITAGVSYEDLTFDCLVAYLTNSTFTPTVDVTLQQLFRVRRLREGNMYLYVNNQIYKNNQPVLEEDIDEYLGTDNTLLQKHFNIVNAGKKINITQDSNNKETKYDLTYIKDTFSYLIIKGITTVFNRSYQYYTETLITTLKKDYNIPVEEKYGSICTSDMQFILEAENAITDELPPFDKGLVITEEEYYDLCDIEQLTPLQRIQVYIHDISRRLWEIETELIDAEFYNKYIKVTSNIAHELVYIAQRYKKASRYTHMELCEQYSEIIKKLKDTLQIVRKESEDERDINISMYIQRKKGYFNKLLIGTMVLNSMHDEVVWKDAMKNFKNLTIREEVLETKYGEMREKLTAEERKEMDKLYTINEKSTPYIIINGVLKKSFGIKLKRGSTNSTADTYKDIIVDMSEHKAVFEKYKPMLGVV